MSRKEARRPGLVKAAVAGKITNAEGARALDMTSAAVPAPQGPVSGRGASGAWSTGCGAGPRAAALDVDVRDRVRELLQTTYRDFNDCHCHREAPRGRGPARQPQHRPPDPPGAWACRPSAAAGPRSTGPAARGTRPWAASSCSTAARSTGSAPGPPLLLLGAIDDATSTVLALHFRPAEDLHGYLTLLAAARRAARPAR